MDIKTWPKLQVFVSVLYPMTFTLYNQAYLGAISFLIQISFNLTPQKSKPYF